MTPPPLFRPTSASWGGERTIQFEDADGHDGVVLDGVSVSGYFQRGVSIERGDQAVTDHRSGLRPLRAFRGFFTPSIWIASGQTRHDRHRRLDLRGRRRLGSSRSGRLAGEIRDNVIETRHDGIRINEARDVVITGNAIGASTGIDSGAGGADASAAPSRLSATRCRASRERASTMASASW